MGKRFFCLICLLSFWGRDLSAQSLYIWNVKGNMIKIVNMGTMPVVKITGDSMKIDTSGMVLKYGIKDVHKFTFEKGNTDIGSAISQTVFHNENGQIIIHGVKSADYIAVYTVGGVSIPVNVNRQEDHYVLALEDLRPGVYLLSVNGQTTKFVKK